MAQLTWLRHIPVDIQYMFGWLTKKNWWHPTPFPPPSSYQGVNQKSTICLCYNKEIYTHVVDTYKVAYIVIKAFTRHFISSSRLFHLNPAILLPSFSISVSIKKQWKRKHKMMNLEDPRNKYFSELLIYVQYTLLTESKNSLTAGGVFVQWSF